MSLAVCVLSASCSAFRYRVHSIPSTTTKQQLTLQQNNIHTTLSHIFHNQSRSFGPPEPPKWPQVGYLGGYGGLLGHLNRDSRGPGAPRSPQSGPKWSQLGYLGCSNLSPVEHPTSTTSRAGLVVDVGCPNGEQKSPNWHPY